jgi:hypothetical protein
VPFNSVDIATSLSSLSIRRTVTGKLDDVFITYSKPTGFPDSSIVLIIISEI